MTIPDRTTERPRVAVIGGGITGLAAAYRLVERDPRVAVTLFCAESRVGGALWSERHDDFLLELGADSFITNVPWAVDLCERIGFTAQLQSTNPAERRAQIVRDGKLYPVPEGFVLMEPRALWPVLTSPLLSFRGKARLLAEYFIPARRNNADESLASFARRRLGEEAFARLVQPLVAGIYTADPERLSLGATMPRFLDMEREHGGLIRAARRAKTNPGDARASGARYSMFTAPRDGMQALPEAIAARLPAGTVRLGAKVTQVAPRATGEWDLAIAGAAEREPFSAVICALPAHRAGSLVHHFDASLGGALAAIPYASSAVLVAAYEDSQLTQPLSGFGFVVPEIERRSILAVSYSSQKFAHRAPQGWSILRVFFGGAARPELATAPDEELHRLAAAELRELLAIQGAPHVARIARWERAMPQYHLGHLDRIAEIQAKVADWPGLELAGNAFTGVGVPHCIRSGQEAAERVLASIGSRARG